MGLVGDMREQLLLQISWGNIDASGERAYRGSS